MNKIITPSQLRDAIRNVPDFPVKGIQFKDLTTVLKQPRFFTQIVNDLSSYYRDKHITKVVAIESRGFITGGALAYQLSAGFVPVRKPGKLPADKYAQPYALEYGIDQVEIHQDALSADDVVLLHDDLLATGGTSLAAIELLKRFGVRTIYINFIVELSFLNGRQRFPPEYDIYSLIQF